MVTLERQFLSGDKTPGFLPSIKPDKNDTPKDTKSYIPKAPDKSKTHGSTIKIKSDSKNNKTITILKDQDVKRDIERTKPNSSGKSQDCKLAKKTGQAELSLDKSRDQKVKNPGTRVLTDIKDRLPLVPPRYARNNVPVSLPKLYHNSNKHHYTQHRFTTQQPKGPQRDQYSSAHRNSKDLTKSGFLASACPHHGGPISKKGLSYYDLLLAPTQDFQREIKDIFKQYSKRNGDWTTKLPLLTESPYKSTSNTNQLKKYRENNLKYIRNKRKYGAKMDAEKHEQGTKTQKSILKKGVKAESPEEETDHKSLNFFLEGEDGKLHPRDPDFRFPPLAKLRDGQNWNKKGVTQGNEVRASKDFVEVIKQMESELVCT